MTIPEGRHPLRQGASAEIAAVAAKLVVEEGMEYGQAKRKAARALGVEGRRGAPLPDNNELESAVFAYIEVFCADTQPGELLALRRVALGWMDRLAPFRPHLSGAVWRGNATRLSRVHLQLYCDDSKSAELALIDQRIDFDVASATGPRGEMIDVLVVTTRSAELGAAVDVHLTVLDHDDLRGALRRDAGDRAERGDAAAVRALIGPP